MSLNVDLARHRLPRYRMRDPRSADTWKGHLQQALDIGLSGHAITFEQIERFAEDARSTQQVMA